MLHVKKLDERAILPTVAYKEDLGYDLYALEEAWVYNNGVTKVRTGIACASGSEALRIGFIIKDRSSMAAKGVFTHAGVIDPGYRGELLVLLTHIYFSPYHIMPGDKIAQLVPVLVLTGPVMEVTDLSVSSRGENKFGSSGR